MAEAPTAPEEVLTDKQEFTSPDTSSKKGLSYFKSLIRSGVASFDEDISRFGGNPDATPLRAKRHRVVKELKLKNQVMYDTTTRLINKAPFEEIEKRTLATLDRDPSAPPILEMLLDIDNFGDFNNEYGYDYGDETLSKVGSAILATIREEDLAGRIGGEEAKILTLKTTSEDTSGTPREHPLVESIRRNIESIQLKSGRQVTVSVGVAEYQRGEGAESFGLRQHSALKVAKKEGKNRVVESFIHNDVPLNRSWATGKIYRVDRDENNKIIGIVEVKINEKGEIEPVLEESQ